MFRLFFISFTLLSMSLYGQTLEQAKLAVDTLFFSDKPAALLISESKLEESIAKNDTFHITYFLDQAGELNRFLGNLYKAEGQLKQCLKYKENWEDLRDLSITYNNLGKTYKMQGNTEAAYSNFLEALKLMEIDSNLLGQSYYLSNIGTLFDDQKDHLKAISYYEKSLEIKEAIGDSIGMATSAINLGISYFKINEFEKAMEHFLYAYRNDSHEKEETRKIRTINNIVRTSLKLNKPAEALKYLKESLNYQKGLDDEILRIEWYHVFAEYYLAVDELDSSLYYISKSDQLAKNTGALQKIQDVYFTKSDIFERQNKTDSALYYLQKGVLYFDSIAIEASVNKVVEMEARYHTEKNLRLRQAAELEAVKMQEELTDKQIQILYLVFALSVIAAISVILLVKFRAKKQNSELLTGQKVLIEKQNLTLKRLNTALRQELEIEKFNSKEKEEILSNVFSKSHQSKLPQELLDLSKRETEVLANLALGLSDDQLAKKLFVSKSTVKTHLRRIYAKLLVKSRAQAVSIAHKYGIIGDAEQE